MKPEMINVQITYRDDFTADYQLSANACFDLITQIRDETLDFFEIKRRFYLKGNVAFIHFDSILEEKTQEVKRGSTAFQFYEVREEL